MGSQLTTIFVVDDDRLLRESLTLMARSVGFKAIAYSSAEEFLDGYSAAPDGPQCLVLDIRLGGMSGLGLQEKLCSQKLGIPVIMMTGYGEVSMAVQAMRAGATDFLEKPFNRSVLLETIQRSLDLDAERRYKRSHCPRLNERVELLSSREREVMDLLVAAKGTKEIAAALGICTKTVAKHRLRILEKLQVDSVVELVRGELAQHS